MPSRPPDLDPVWGLPGVSILDPKLVDFGVPDPDLNVIYSGSGGPDPQIGRFWTHFGSKSGGAGLAGLPKSLCTAVQPARMAVRRGQDPSQIMTKMGYFGGPDPQIPSWSCFGNMDLTKSGGSDPRKWSFLTHFGSDLGQVWSTWGPGIPLYGSSMAPEGAPGTPFGTS